MPGIPLGPESYSTTRYGFCIIDSYVVVVAELVADADMKEESSLKNTWVIRGPANGEAPADYISVEGRGDSRLDGPLDDGSGTLSFAAVIAAGGQGSTRVKFDIASTEFEAIAAAMFEANRDRAIRAFAKALSNTPPIPWTWPLPGRE